MVLKLVCKLCHSDRERPMSCLLKCKFRELVAKAEATVIVGSATILNRLGYKQYKVYSPCHLSSQNEVSLPLPILLMPVL